MPLEVTRQNEQNVLVEHVVAVEADKIVTSRFSQREIAYSGQADSRRVEDTHTRVAAVQLHDLQCLVSRSIVDEQQLPAIMMLPQHTLDRVGQKPRVIMRDDVNR